MTTNANARPSTATDWSAVLKSSPGVIYETTDSYLLSVSRTRLWNARGGGGASACGARRRLWGKGRGSGESQDPVHDADRAAQAGIDPRLHLRRQGILDRQRHGELRIRQTGQGKFR